MKLWNVCEDNPPLSEQNVEFEIREEDVVEGFDALLLSPDETMADFDVLFASESPDEIIADFDALLGATEPPISQDPSTPPQKKRKASESIMQPNTPITQSKYSMQASRKLTPRRLAFGSCKLTIGLPIGHPLHASQHEFNTINYRMTTWSGRR